MHFGRQRYLRQPVSNRTALAVLFRVAFKKDIVRFRLFLSLTVVAWILLTKQ